MTATVDNSRCSENLQTVSTDVTWASPVQQLNWDGGNNIPLFCQRLILSHYQLENDPHEHTPASCTTLSSLLHHSAHAILKASIYKTNCHMILISKCESCSTWTQMHGLLLSQLEGEVPLEKHTHTLRHRHWTTRLTVYKRCWWSSLEGWKTKMNIVRWPLQLSIPAVANKWISVQ